MTAAVPSPEPDASGWPVLPQQARPRPPMEVVLRTEEDLLALAPAVLGFWPDQDVMMQTYGAARSFHARTDLPFGASEDQARAMAAAFVGPAVRFEVDAVALLFTAADLEDADRVWPTLREEFHRAGILVICAIAADGERYRRLDEHPAGGPRGRLRAYDVSDHPIVLQALLEGRIGYGSRAEMVAALEPDPSRVSAVVRAEREAGRRGRQLSTSALVAVAHAIYDPVPPNPVEVADLLRVIDRDAAWLQLCGDGGPPAEEACRFWAAVLPQTPDEYVADVASVLGFAAWRRGDGAMAWVAVDRARRAEPGHESAERLAGLLEEAVPPPRPS